MSSIFESYDYPVGYLVDFYRRLNTPVAYPDGMQVSLDALYWGKHTHYPALLSAIPQLEEQGLASFSQLLEAIHTTSRMNRFAGQTGISISTLRILKHDIGLWLPQAIPLERLGLGHEHTGSIHAITRLAITDQLQVISQAQHPRTRAALARQACIALSTLDEITRFCDLYRTGRNLGHIRDRIYYDMGLDTWQKWADVSSEEIIARFSDYVNQHHLEAMRLVPWPREVRNGIEWAKLHLSIFAVEW